MIMKKMTVISRVAAYFFDIALLIIFQHLLGNIGLSGYILSLFLFFLYRFITTALKGATLGMLIFKLKLKRYNFKTCLKREIFRAASHFYYLGYFYVLFDPYLRTFHDVMSGTYIEIDKEEKPLKRDRWVKAIGSIFLAIFILKWTSNFVLNDAGLLGLKKIAESDEYFQSFEGDNIVSLSQEELFMKTMGRKYTALIEAQGEKALVRISNKQKYTEVYKLIMEDSGLRGEYLYKVDYPLQFICSGKFLNNRDLCGLSPKGELIIANEKGEIYGSEKVEIASPVTMKCGDINGDGRDEIIVMGIGGDAEVFKMGDKTLKKVFLGKFGEDILPETFYIKDGVNVFGKSNKGDILYNYKFKNERFIFNSKRYTKIKGISNVFCTDHGVLVSNVYRNEMMFKRGKIQRLEVYTDDLNYKKVYEFGNRPGRPYAYMVRTLEDAEDIDNDGKTEVVLKTVGKDDVMGQGYIVEIYKFDERLLKLNRFFTEIQRSLK